MNVVTDDMIAAAQLRDHIPGKPHRTTIAIWLKNGVEIGGTTVKLRSVLRGKRRFVHRDWIGQFLEDCTAAASGPQPTLSPSQREQQAQAALDVLNSK